MLHSNIKNHTMELNSKEMIYLHCEKLSIKFEHEKCIRALSKDRIECLQILEFGVEDLIVRETNTTKTK